MKTFKSLPFILFILFFTLCSALSCGSRDANFFSKVVPLGGSGGDSGLDGGAGVVIAQGGSGGTILIEPDSGMDAAAGASVYKLPDGFTATEKGGYMLGPVYDPTMDYTSGGSSSCGTQILGVVRDFRGSNLPNGHPDFEAFMGQSASPGIVNAELGDDQKLVYSPLPNDPFIDPVNGQQTTNQTNFDQWYRNTDDVNMAYIVYLYFQPVNGILVLQSNSYFPLDNAGFGNTPGYSHNYSFTTEVHTQFHYKGGETFSFTGDDDLWVFINKKLAVDLGGVHTPVSMSISLDEVAKNLDITVGQTYDLSLFNAERHTVESNFHVETDLSFTNCGTIPPPPK